MKNRILKLLLVGSFIFQITGIILLAEEKIEDSPLMQTAKEILVSNDSKEREELLISLLTEYNKIKHILWNNLTEAKNKNLTDRGYYSPLHTAILAVSAWKVYEAERILFSIIDYNLDDKTLPLGASFVEGYCYPAARALIEIRVPSGRVIDAVKNAKNETQIKILTWVLVTCSDDDFEKAELQLKLAKEKPISDSMKANIDTSLKWLKGAENRSLLLPFPS